MAGLFGLDEDASLGLLTAALAAMSARGVRPGTALAQGGLLGLGAMQQAKEGRKDERRQQLQEQLWQSQMAENLSQSEERRAKIAQAQEAAQRQAKISAGAPRVGVPEFNTGTPGYSSGVAQSFGVPEAKPADTKVDVYAQLARKAAYLADNNDIDTAVKYVDMANKMKPKYSPTLSVVLDPATNKHILVQASETEMPRPVQGMAPERKVELKDFGGSLGAVDMRDLMPGASFPKTMTAEGRDASARGWADINDRRKREVAEAAAKAAGGADVAPKWDSPSGTFIYPPTATSPGKSVRPEGYPEKSGKNAENAKQLPGIIAEAESILSSGAPTGSAVGYGTDLAMGAVGASTRGAEATAKLRVLSAKLMFAQPRFEGPQGVLDVKLYEQAAGDIANPMKPVGVRLAALQTIKEMHNKYGPAAPITGTGSGGAAPAAANKQVKRTGTTKDGRRVVEYTDGTREVQ